MFNLRKMRLISLLLAVQTVCSIRVSGNSKCETCSMLVMLPLNTVNNDGTLNDPGQIQNWFQQLKSGGVDAIMTDVWWGIVEQTSQNYMWVPYLQLAQMAETAGLKMQVVMSFRNVGDTCDISLPPWVKSVAKQNSDIYYKDSDSSSDEEYLSLGIDHEALFGGRTPIDIYKDFMQSFATELSQYMGSVINQVQIGLGPAGELRYPSYQLSKWSYCGIGAFQCYDQYMLQNLQQAAIDAGQPSWGHPPTNAGSYNDNIYQDDFWEDNKENNYASDYGKFFINWYSQQIINHGKDILTSADEVFSPVGVGIAAKVSGIHWWYDTHSHAAEVTAGYDNTDSNDAYLELASMFADVGSSFDFTCLEKNGEDDNCKSVPQNLVKQAIMASQKAGVKFDGENALPLCDPNCYEGGFDQIVQSSSQYGKIERFTYLRLDSNLFESNNWNIFTNFVNRMHSL